MKDAVPRVAMVLAAGRGVRMSPLTRHRAKPALPVLGTPLLARILRQLDRAGVRTIAVNAHHAAESIERVVTAAETAAEVRVFREPVLMGSGGALAGPRDLLAAGGRFALLNGDTLCRPPLAAMARVLDERRAGGVLLVRTPADRRYRPLRVAGDRVLGLGSRGETGAERATYLGVAVLSPDVLDRIPDDRPSDLFDALLPLVDTRGGLVAFGYDGPWLEMTSPESYRRALTHLVLGARNRDAVELPGGSVRVRRCRQGAAFIAADADVHPAAELRGGVVVESGASVGAGAVLSATVVLEGAVVEPLAVLEDVVVMEGARVPAGSTLRSGIVDAADGGSAEATSAAGGRR